MSTSDIFDSLEQWRQRLGREERGHAQLFEPFDALVRGFSAARFADEDAARFFATAIDVIACEFETSVKSCVHPPATMQSYRYFRNLELTAKEYVVRGGWLLYLNRLIELLVILSETMQRDYAGVKLPILPSHVAERLTGVFRELRGSALRGPRFKCHIPLNKKHLASFLEAVGFEVPDKSLTASRSACR